MVKKTNEPNRDIFAFILCRSAGACHLPTNQLTSFWCSNGSVPYPPRDKALQYCRNAHCAESGFCTMLLEQNSWDFPKDYPVRL